MNVFLWQVRGKYGYYDPEGILREASYGATSKGGFEPHIAGLVLLVQLQRDQSESFRSLPAVRAKALVAPTEPYVSYGSELSSYSISY